MSYRILTQNGIENTNIDGARDYNFNTGRKSGVVKGVLEECALSVNDKTISVGKGELRLSGHRIVIEEAETFTILTTPSVTTKYSLIAKITVVDTQPNFDIGVMVYPAQLVQNDLDADFNGSGIFEIELGTFELDTTGSILNLSKTVLVLDGNNLTEEEKEKLNKIVIAGNGDKFLADDGTYKEVGSGSSVTVDSELSLSSENPVQNKVVTEELEGKMNFPTKPTDIGGTVRVAAVGTDGKTQNWIRVNPVFIYSRNSYSQLIPMYCRVTDNFSSEVALSKIPNTIFTAVPQKDYQAANKLYVDDNVAKLHTITIPFSEDSEMPTYENSIVIKFFSLSKNLISYSTEFNLDVGGLQIDDYAKNYIVSSPLVGATTSVSGDTAKQMTVQYAEDGYNKGFWYSFEWSELGLNIKSIDTANIVEVVTMLDVEVAKTGE